MRKNVHAFKKVCLLYHFCFKNCVGVTGLSFLETDPSESLIKKSYVFVACRLYQVLTSLVSILCATFQSIHMVQNLLSNYVLSIC